MNTHVGLLLCLLPASAGGVGAEPKRCRGTHTIGIVTDGQGKLNPR